MINNNYNTDDYIDFLIRHPNYTLYNIFKWCYIPENYMTKYGSIRSIYYNKSYKTSRPEVWQIYSHRKNYPPKPYEKGILEITFLENAPISSESLIQNNEYYRMLNSRYLLNLVSLKSGGDRHYNYYYKTGWDALSLNNNVLYWNIDLINKYADKLNFINLAKNRALPWSKDLIEHFFTKEFEYYWIVDESVSICEQSEYNPFNASSKQLDPFRQIENNPFNNQNPWTFEILKRFENNFIFMDNASDFNKVKYNIINQNYFDIEKTVIANSEVWHNIFSNILSPKLIRHIFEYYENNDIKLFDFNLGPYEKIIEYNFKSLLK